MHFTDVALFSTVVSYEPMSYVVNSKNDIA